MAYDEAGEGGAARLWWLLRHFGHEEVAVLDGGLAAWREAGGPLRAGEETVEPGDFVARPREGDTADADEAGAAPVLLDARAPARYRGESEPIDPVAGHIPGAVNLPSSELAPGGRFLDPGELRARLERAGAAPGRDVVAYCGSGVTACTIVLAAELAGLGPARLYPGSWSEWSRGARPVERSARRLKRAPIPADTGTIFSRPDHIRLPGEPVPRRGSMPRTRVLSAAFAATLVSSLVARLRTARRRGRGRGAAPSSPTGPRTPRRSGASASRAGRARGCCCRSAASGRFPASVLTNIVDSSLVQRPLSRVCPAGQSIRAISRMGAVTCQSDRQRRAPLVFNFTAAVPLLDITNSGTGGGDRGQDHPQLPRQRGRAPTTTGPTATRSGRSSRTRTTPNAAIFARTAGGGRAIDAEVNSLTSSADALFARTRAPTPSSYAGYFSGNVKVTGNLDVDGTLSKAAGAFRINHPLSPATRYLQHSFVESPDMKNIYDGVVRTERARVRHGAPPALVPGPERATSATSSPRSAPSRRRSCGAR